MPGDTTETIVLDHGSGGKLAHQLTTEVLLPLFDNPLLSPLNDGAMFELNGARLAFSTDTFVVAPLFFPGGNIGDLAVNGTINDLAMCGAVPRYLSMGLILEEGLPMAELEKILASARNALDRAGVQLVTGDTKVVPRGAADKIFINTSGIGTIDPLVTIDAGRACPGDSIILSGTMADHGMAVLTQREGLRFESNINSDTAPLNHMVQRVLKATDNRVHVLRDPTRGGVATALNEIAIQSQVGMMLREDGLPMDPETAGVCELLGYDPLYVANEGKMLCILPDDQAEAALSAMRAEAQGRRACIIGEITAEHPGRVVMLTRVGGRRIVDMLAGEQLPRIC